MIVPLRALRCKHHHSWHCGREGAVEMWTREGQLATVGGLQTRIIVIEDRRVVCSTDGACKPPYRIKQNTKFTQQSIYNIIMMKHQYAKVHFKQRLALYLRINVLWQKHIFVLLRIFPILLKLHENRTVFWPIIIQLTKIRSVERWSNFIKLAPYQSYLPALQRINFC